MWFVVLNAIFFHFYHFHPYPSPGTGKYYHLKKRPEIALCGRISLFYLHMIPNGVIFGIIEQKFGNWKINKSKLIYNARYTLHVSHFLVNTIYHNIVNHIYYHLPNYPYYTKYATQDSMIFNTIISILQYCYHIVTIL